MGLEDGHALGRIHLGKLEHVLEHLGQFSVADSHCVFSWSDGQNMHRDGARRFVMVRFYNVHASYMKFIKACSGACKPQANYYNLVKHPIYRLQRRLYCPWIYFNLFSKTLFT